MLWVQVSPPSADRMTLLTKVPSGRTMYDITCRYAPDEVRIGLV